LNLLFSLDAIIFLTGAANKANIHFLLSFLSVFGFRIFKGFEIKGQQ